MPAPKKPLEIRVKWKQRVQPNWAGWEIGIWRGLRRLRRWVAPNRESLRYYLDRAAKTRNQMIKRGE